MVTTNKPRRRLYPLRTTVLWSQYFRDSHPHAWRRRQVRWVVVVCIGISVVYITLWSHSKNGDALGRKLPPSADSVDGVPSDKKRHLRYDREREETNSKGVFPPLEELLDRDRLWPPDLDKPLCSVKIFVYHLPPHLQLPQASVSRCRWSAYNSELLLHSLLLPSTSSPIAHTYITTDPSEANFFFIPLFPSCYLFNCWVDAGWKKSERCDVDEAYIAPVMRYIQEEQPYYNNSSPIPGSNHLIVHPMDYTDGYYTERSRALMNSSIYLVTVGDRRPPPYGSHYRPYRDIVIPSSTHLLNSYYINPMDYLDQDGNPLVDGPRGPAAESNLHRTRKGRKGASAPVPTQVEIFTPSPSVESSVWSSTKEKLQQPKRWMWRMGGAQVKERLLGKRMTTVLFRGGLGREGEGESYSLGIRSLFFPDNGTLPAVMTRESVLTTSPTTAVTRSSSDVLVESEKRHPHPGFSSLPGWDLALSSENDEYALLLSTSKYGLVPPGYTLDTTRLWEYLAFGVVPIFLGTGPRGGQVMPFEYDLDYNSFTIFVPRSEVHLLPTLLESSVSEREYERLRREVWRTGRRLVLEQGQGNVWHWIVRDLCRMSIGTPNTNGRLGGGWGGAGDRIEYT